MSERLVSRSGAYKFTLYVPEQDEEVVMNFIKDCQARGCSASSVLLDYIRSFSPVVEKPKEECEICGKSSEALYVARFVSGQKMRVCSGCFKVRFDKGLVRAVIKKPVEVVFNPNLHGSKGNEGGQVT